MVLDLHEFVRVGAVFDKNGLKPVWFEHKGGKIKIAKIFYQWREKSKNGAGAEKILKFSVYDGVSLYEISFDPTNLKWTLTACEEVYSDESGMDM